MRSNKWEGEDEEEEVKVMRFSVMYATRGPFHASRVQFRTPNLYSEHMFPTPRLSSCRLSISLVYILKRRVLVIVVIVMRERRTRNVNYKKPKKCKKKSLKERNQEGIICGVITCLIYSNKSIYLLFHVFFVHGRISRM